MNKTTLLIAANARAQLRWFKEHIYTAVILTPIVLSITYASLSGLTAEIAKWQPSAWLTILVAATFALCLIVMSLSRASAELYHIRRPESAFDAFPLSVQTHLHNALLNRLTRTAITALLLAVLVWLVIGAALLNPIRLLAVVPLIVVLAVSQLFAALNWIHWNHRREARAGLLAVLALALAATFGGLLLVPFVRPHLLPVGLIGVALPASLVWSLALYLLLARWHARWRVSDLEYARRLQPPGRWSVVNARLFHRRLGAIVAAQVVRDLRLTLRAFSSAVYIVATLCLLALLVLFILLRENLLPPPIEISGWFDMTWLPVVMATKAACVIVTCLLVALLPVLLAYELPLYWLERAVGTTGLDIWNAKLWYARLVSLPAPFLVFLVSLLSGQAPAVYLLAMLAECLWLWWMTSSLAAALIFEMPTRAGLSIILIVTLGLASGMVAAMLWPFGLIFYVYAMESLTKRGRARARYYLMTGEE